MSSPLFVSLSSVKRTKNHALFQVRNTSTLDWKRSSLGSNINWLISRALRHKRWLWRQTVTSLLQGGGKRRQRPWQTSTHCGRPIVTDTDISLFARSRNIVADPNFVPETQKMFLIFFRKFCVHHKASLIVCALKETLWATMCPPQCVLVCYNSYKLCVRREMKIVLL